MGEDKPIQFKLRRPEALTWRAWRKRRQRKAASAHKKLVKQRLAEQLQKERK